MKNIFNLLSNYTKTFVILIFFFAILIFGFYPEFFSFLSPQQKITILVISLIIITYIDSTLGTVTKK